MSRRQAGDTAGGDGDIELLDVADPSAPSSTPETVATAGRQGNAVAAAAAVIIGAIGVAALSSSGTDPSPTAPTTTAPSTPSTSDAGPSTTTPRTADPDERRTVIGEGPQLIWQELDLSIDATAFRWTGNSFIGTGGADDHVIGPDPQEPAFTTYEGGLASARIIESSSVVVADGTPNPSELVILEPWQTRIPITPIAVPDSDLIDAVIDLDVERKGPQVLVLQRLSAVLDADRFRARTGTGLDPIFGIAIGDSVITVSGADGQEDLAIDDLDLSADDMAALALISTPTRQLSLAGIDPAGVGYPAISVEADLDRIDWIAVVGSEFIIGGNEMRRSSDGVEWEATSSDTPRFGGLHPPGPDGVLTGLAVTEATGFLTISTDAARSWQTFPRPFDTTWSTESVYPIVATTGWRSDPFVPTAGAWSVLTPEYALTFDDDESTFVLATRDGETILSGRTEDPGSGFRFAPGSEDIWFVDPASGVEIARVDRTAFTLALASTLTQRNDPQLVAFADISGGPGSITEWSLTPVNELFGSDALSVAFTAGDGWFLADVTTITGRDLYIAEVDPPESPLR